MKVKTKVNIVIAVVLVFLLAVVLTLLERGFREGIHEYRSDILVDARVGKPDINEPGGTRFEVWGRWGVRRCFFRIGFDGKLFQVVTEEKDSWKRTEIEPNSPDWEIWFSRFKQEVIPKATSGKRP